MLQRVHGAALPRRLGGGAYDTPFVLPFYMIYDNWELWFILTGMIVFLVVVDRIQWLIAKGTESDYGRDLFRQRIDVELLMFGLVAISIFFVESLFYKLTTEQMYEFHYADLLCSAGAVGLICYGGFLMIIMAVVTRKFSNYADGKIDNHLDLYCLAALFMTRHVVEPGFDFALYMKESLSESLAEFITISYLCWVILGFPVLFMLILTATIDFGEIDAIWKVVTYFIFCCFILLFVILLVIIARCARRSLKSHITEHDEDLVRELVQDWYDREGTLPPCSGEFTTLLSTKTQYLDANTDHWQREAFGGAGSESDASDASAILEKSYKAKKKIRRLVKILAFFIQLAGLTFFMVFSFYLCHILWNIYLCSLNAAWHIAIIFPLLLCALLLPMAVLDCSVLEALLTPKPETMDRVINYMHQYNEDCEHIKRQLLAAAAHGRLDIDSLESQVEDEEVIGGKYQFQYFLAMHQVHIARKRLGRTLDLMDVNDDGSLTVTEFLNAVNGDPPGTDEGTGALMLIKELRMAEATGTAPRVAVDNGHD